MACNSVNLFNALTGNDPGGTFYDDDGLFGAPGSVVGTPTALDFTGVADGTYAFTYEVCIDCDLDGDTLDPGECDTVTFNVEVYNLPDIADISLCEDDPQWYTVIGDPAANPTHITLVDGNQTDYTVSGSPSGIPNQFTAAGLGAPFNSTITITLTPNSGAAVQCACLTVFNIEVEALPSTTVSGDEVFVCASCSGPTYDLTSITGYTDETWYTTNTGGGTCDGTTVNNGTYTGALENAPTAAPIEDGLNVFYAVKQISGGPCGDRYVCQEVNVWAITTPPASNVDALQIDEVPQDVCQCTGDYDISLGSGLNCFEDYWQQLLANGGSAVLSGYSETITLGNGVYGSYTWDVCDSEGTSILSATNNVSDMDFDSLQIACSDFDGIPDGDLTVKFTITTGFIGTECINHTYELTIPHTTCCEDCTYSIEARDPITQSNTNFNDSRAVQAGNTLRVRWFADHWVSKTCDTSGAYPDVKVLDDDLVWQTGFRYAIDYADAETQGFVTLTTGNVNPPFGITVFNEDDLADWLQANHPTGGADWSTIGSNVVLSVHEDNTLGLSPTGANNNLEQGSFGAALGTITDATQPPCGTCEATYPSLPNQYSFIDVGIPGSGSDYEIDYNAITINAHYTITTSPSTTSDAVCTECS